MVCVFQASDVGTAPEKAFDIERCDNGAGEFHSLCDPVTEQIDMNRVAAIPSFQIERAEKEVHRRRKRSTKHKKAIYFNAIVDYAIFALGGAGIGMAAACTYLWYTGQLFVSEPSLGADLTNIRATPISHVMPMNPSWETPSVRFSTYSPQVQFLIRDLMNSSSTESDDDVASSWDQWMMHREPPPTWVSTSLVVGRSAPGSLAGAPMVSTTMRVRMAPLIPNIVARLQALDQRGDKVAAVRNFLAIPPSQSLFDLGQFPSTDSDAFAARGQIARPIDSDAAMAEGLLAHGFPRPLGDDMFSSNVVVPSADFASTADGSSIDTLGASHLNWEPAGEDAATQENIDPNVTDAVIDCIHSRWGSSKSSETEFES